jgi:hypothetical protein
MQQLIVLIVALLISVNSNAQYREIHVQKSNYDLLKIVQIDFRDESTLIHFTYTSSAPDEKICANESFYVQSKETTDKYKLINSINLPICDKIHMFETANQEHNFTLEFEKFPETIGEFDIIEEAESGFSFFGVVIQTESRTAELLDVADFVNKTPMKEYGYFFKDGQTVLYCQHNGLLIGVILTVDNSYGKYFQANILVQNLTGRAINLDPGLITANTAKNQTINSAHVLTYNEYMKRVRNRQSWGAVAYGFSESMAAHNAGRASSSTQTSVNGNYNSSSSASGHVGGTTGSVYGNSTVYGTAAGTNNTQSQDGAAQYAAQQNANKNMAQYQSRQFQVRNTLSEGYLRLNTITNETEYLGYVNIEYSKVDNIQLRIPLNGSIYEFVW